MRCICEEEAASRVHGVCCRLLIEDELWPIQYSRYHKRVLITIRCPLQTRVLLDRVYLFLKLILTNGISHGDEFALILRAELVFIVQIEMMLCHELL